MAGPGAPLGSQNAKKAKRYEGALTRALAKAADGQGVEAGLEKVAAMLVKAALAGESWAIKELADRIDGKAAQSVEVEGGSNLLAVLGGLRKTNNP